MRRRIAALAAAGIAVVAVLGFGAPGAGADAPAQQGWWTAETASTPVGAPAPVAPDVPARGLLIEGGPSKPVAYGGLVYPIATGYEAMTLTLKVAPSSASTPNSSLELCVLDDASFHAAQGGPMDDAPTYKCDQHVTAALADGGYQFDVAGLVSDGLLAVAVLPTQPTDRVVLAAPDDSSLTVRSTGAPSTSDPGPSIGDATTPNNFDATGSNSFGTSFGGSSGGDFVPDVPVAPVPTVAAPAVQAPSTSGQPVSSLSDLPPNPLSSNSPAEPLAVTLVVAAVAAGVVMWSRAGRAAVARAATSLGGASSEPQVPTVNVTGVLR